MNFQIVTLGRDYHGKITDFAAARNSFIEQLADDEWILFVDDDSEVPNMLLNRLRTFNPPSDARYYSIRCVNLTFDRYNPAHNPFFWRCLVSNKVRYYGGIHERIKGQPSGLIDIPLIHNHTARHSEGYAAHAKEGKFWTRSMSPPLWNMWLAGKKVKDVVTRGHYDPRVW